MPARSAAPPGAAAGRAGLRRLRTRGPTRALPRIAGLLDEQVQAFRQRPLGGRYPHLLVDAKIRKVRDGGRLIGKAVVVAHAVHETGRREIIGLDIGAAETEAFWTEFCEASWRAALWECSWPSPTPTRA